MPIKKTAVSDKHWEYNRLNSAILVRQLKGEITDAQAKEEMKILHSMYPEFANATEEQKPDQKEDPIDDKEDPWHGLGPQWRKRSAEIELGLKIPPAAKAIMRHRSACGVKLSDKDLARFWSKINVKSANDCWTWKNSLRGSLGYGQFRIGDRICDAHRISLELAKGPLPKGRYVCHSCDNPKCCNPKHLFAGTQKNNVDDMTEKGRGDN